MIEVVIADHQELFSIGLTEVLAGQDDVRVVGQPQSPEQLLKTLRRVRPHILVLSTDFLPVYPRIKRILKRRKTALLLLAERNDRAAYMLWLRAHGIVYRSMDAPIFLDAMRRVARGELFVQDSSSDLRRDEFESSVA
jgi:two-component system, NarL family, response regulator